MFIARAVCKRRLSDHALRPGAILVQQKECSVQNMLPYVMTSSLTQYNTNMYMVVQSITTVRSAAAQTSPSRRKSLLTRS